MSRFYLSALLTCGMLCSGLPLFAEDSYTREIRPLLTKYCLSCHSTAKQEGELDLERLGDLAAAKRQPAIWQNVAEQLTNNEMPPKEKPQPTAEEKTKLQRWIQQTLDAVALANAGDPGPVVLRRLSNAEYGYTVRDLTGVETLDPAAEFPADNAAGEGFTNTGAALVMSPALLTKYLDAGKRIAEHAVLHPTGIRFSPYKTERDWTDETLGKIRSFYAQFSTSGGATAVNLQGIQFDTNAGGRLPSERYLAVLVSERDSLHAGKKKLADIAAASGLNEKYLSLLWQGLTDTQPSIILAPLRKQFATATPETTPQLVAAVQMWQQSLWRFTSVGHIGKRNGPSAWQEPVTPLVAQHEIRLKLTPPADGSDVTLYLATGDAGDSSPQDVAIWENPRLVAAGRPDLPLKNLGGVMQQLTEHRKKIIASTAQALAAAAEAEVAEQFELAQLAEKHRVDSALLASWFRFLGISAAAESNIGPLVKNKAESAAGYNFVQGWTGADALSLLANSSDAEVAIPGKMKAHSLTIHPAPKVAGTLAWRSPIAAKLQIDGFVQDAHTACGNGVAWSLEVRRGKTRERLAAGVTAGDKVMTLPRQEKVVVAVGDVIALVIHPRDGSHICDLTAIDLTLRSESHTWNASEDLTPNILAGNPHADRHGNPNVWHFAGEAMTAETAPALPPGTLLAEWRQAGNLQARKPWGEKLQQLLAKEVNEIPADSPDRALHQQLLAWNGPLLAGAFQKPLPTTATGSPSAYGIDPALYGKLPAGDAIDPLHFAVQAPNLWEVKIPAPLAAGAEFVVVGRLQAAKEATGSVQIQALTTKPTQLKGITASPTETKTTGANWLDYERRTIHTAPIIVAENSTARQLYEASFREFRDLFPLALCYTKIVPVDEVVTLTLFYREDQHLQRLMLNAEQQAYLNQLWNELRFVSAAPLKQVDVFEQLWQYATQDADPSAFEPLRQPTLAAAAAFKREQLAAEPRHLQAVLDFAAKVWRRPVSSQEQDDLRTLYAKLRQEELPHEPAIRLLIARLFVAPAFLYRGERAGAGTKPTAIDDYELATRLSYFLWSSTPDAELLTLAAVGQLKHDDVLRQQVVRMLKDAKIRRLATEFGCQWLHVRDVATLDEKSERHFPTFARVREAMQEETTRFFIDFFQQNRSTLSLLNADHTFVNGPLAEHYGLPVKGTDWQRIDGLRAQGRGGVLGFASTLAKQSGASRTSPILRGNWVSEVLLGEKLPKPPKGVPLLPEEPPAGLSERQLIERHSIDPKCITCHQRIDPLGFALEGFDAIGRARAKDTAGEPIDTAVKLPTGESFAGLAGLREYLAVTRQADFLWQFYKKLLGYSLGRAVQLSDKPLLDALVAKQETNEHRIQQAVEMIVLSPAFRQVRGRDYPGEHE